MREALTVIGYVIADPEGRCPAAPEFPFGRLEEALGEARDLNRAFAEEIGEGAYRVAALFANGAAALVA